MSPSLSKFTLASHITFSVGWLGAVATFLVLAVVGLVGLDNQLTQSMYVAMELLGWFVIVPFCISALSTGTIQSLGTQWGLFRHYWVVIKLLLTVVATVMLFVHMKPISYVAAIASERALSSSDLRGLRIQLIADAAVALFVLLVATGLSVYKPWGKIQNSFSRKSNDSVSVTLRKATRKPWGLYVILGLISIFLIIVILHLFGIGMKSH